jgi:hypothetical protein
MVDQIDNVTELRPKAGRLQRAKPDRTNSERQKRFRDKRKIQLPTVTPENTVTLSPVDKAPDAPNAVTVAAAPRNAVTLAHPNPHVDAPPIAPTVTVTRHGAIDAFAYIAAIGLAGAAAWFSIRAMVVLFPGAPVSVVGMAVAMESAKLVTAGLLARRWDTTSWIARLVFMAFILGLATINGVGVFSQLVAAHVGERGAAAARIETQVAAVDARLELAAGKVSDLDRRLGQIDTAIEEAARRGRTNTALAAIEGQRRARAGLASERNKAAGTLESAPTQYVAELLGVTDPEAAIRWLIALMVLTCDPLAIALTAAASARRSTAV